MSSNHPRILGSLLFVFLAAACTKVDPQVSQIFMDGGGPGTDPDPDPGPETGNYKLELFEIDSSLVSRYASSSGMASGSPYFARWDAGKQPDVAQRSDTRDYLVVWDSIGGLEIGDENLMNQPGGFEP